MLPTSVGTFPQLGALLLSINKGRRVEVCSCLLLGLLGGVDEVVLDCCGERRDIL